MRTLDDVLAQAIQRPAFSNGFEGDAWVEAWCQHCVNNHDCPLILVAYLDHIPSEWLVQDPARLGDQYHCVEFRSEHDGPPPGPQPIPTPPGQGELFDRTPYEGARMFADMTVTIRPHPARHSHADQLRGGVA